ncbi:hypothetical protein [Algoriphagus sp. NG3]|uniref:hypothetical protein n=1 Tax=Algoriphagus sp. NG3 TaxID=3097546 RepID=UPI002A7FC785|nr:hypothetical protein [Algoriphagus sp. NG3]WPR73729.1 hypothetical protein SLW71_13680 [Algoriphagus sp. NG3]
MKNNILIVLILVLCGCNQNSLKLKCFEDKEGFNICLPDNWGVRKTDGYLLYSQLDSLGNYLVVNKVEELSNNLFYNYVEKTHLLFSSSDINLIDYSIYEFSLKDVNYIYCVYEYEFHEVNKKFVSVVTSIDNVLFDVSLSVDSVFYEDYKLIFDNTVLPSVVIFGESYFSAKLIPKEINEINSDYLDSLIN